MRNFRWMIGAFLLLGSTLVAQRPHNEYEVFLKNWYEPFPRNAAQILTAEWSSQDVVEGTAYRIIQFERQLVESEKAALSDAGVKLLEYIPRNAWIAAIPTHMDRAILASFPIRGMMALPIETKIKENLLQLPLPNWAIPAEGWIDLHVMAFPGISNASLRHQLAALGGLVQDDESAGWITIRIPQEKIRAVGEIPGVQFVEPIDPPAESENYIARGQHRATALDPGHVAGRQYTGAGVAVGVGDDGSIGPHIDFTGRVDNSSCGGANTGDHADHVTGTIFGAGNLDPNHRGMAPGANIFTYFGGSSLIAALPVDVTSRQIVVANTSQSNGCNAGYTLLTRTVDNIVRLNPQLLMVYSAGNEGVGVDCNYGAGPSWGNVTGGHKMAKNCITVGALTSTDQIASFSSRGPAHDGRIKPEICAKGVAQVSTQDGNRYQTAQGTSMSCPGIAGVSALLYEAYRDSNGGMNPSSALIKALIMNNADDLGNAGPDFIYGYGRVNTLRAVEAIEENRFQQGSLTTGQSDTLTLTVPNGINDLRIMINWLDPEGSINASRALINDLNLRVIDPNGITLLPWVLDETPNIVNLNTPAVRGVDDLNNMEQVTLDSTVPGVYTVIIEGTSIPQGPQTYFMTYTMESGEVQLTYPYGGEELVPGKPERLYWNAQGNSGTFKLEYSTDNGTSWTVIDSTVSGNLRTLPWTVPNINATGQGWMRISRGSEMDTTNLPITFARQPGNLTISHSCPTNFTLSWDLVAGAVGYQVSMLGNQYMDSIATTTADSFIFQGISSANTYWVSVQAITPEGTLGRRAIAIEKTPGEWLCQEPDDVGVSALVEPAPGPVNNCVALSGLVKVEVTNFSPNTATGFSVSYQVNGGSVVTETFAGTLQAYATDTHTFVGTSNFSSPGNYVIKSWATNTGDNNALNDTLVDQVQVISNTPVNAPWSEDFETFTTCGVTPNCGLGTCQLLNGWTNGTNGISDDIDWRTDAGGTQTANTGPSSDHNPGNGTGKYLYLESSSCFGKEGMALTPCLDLGNVTAPQFTFWFHNYGANQGELHLDLYADGVWNEDITPKIMGDWTNKWWERVVDLSAYQGKVVTLRFRGITGNGELSDMAIDDINLDANIAVDDALPQDVQIWPNPSSGLLRAQFRMGAPTSGQVQILDLNGRVMMAKPFTAGASFVELDAQWLSAGVYIVRLEGDGLSGQMKWIKQ